MGHHFQGVGGRLCTQIGRGALGDTVPVHCPLQTPAGPPRSPWPPAGARLWTSRACVCVCAHLCASGSPTSIPGRGRRRGRVQQQGQEAPRRRGGGCSLRPGLNGDKVDFSPACVRAFSANCDHRRGLCHHHHLQVSRSCSERGALGAEGLGALLLGLPAMGVGCWPRGPGAQVTTQQHRRPGLLVPCRSRSWPAGSPGLLVLRPRCWVLFGGRDSSWHWHRPPQVSPVKRIRAAEVRELPCPAASKTPSPLWCQLPPVWLPAVTCIHPTLSLLCSRPGSWVPHWAFLHQRKPRQAPAEPLSDKCTRTSPGPSTSGPGGGWAAHAAVRP